MDFTRKDYEKIRKMDRHQMETYINGVYKQGKQDGFAEAVNMQRKRDTQTADALVKTLESGSCPGVLKVTIAKIKKYALETGFIKAEE
jgi:hypothetical protein